MKIVAQRVKSASLSVGGALVSQIKNGLVVYFGVKVGDGVAGVMHLAKKVANLRVFEDSAGKMNLNVTDAGGEILLVSQFTLYGDISKGNRPSFTLAERPESANLLYERMAEELRAYNLTVKTGVFGADMLIEQQNDGPVTIVYEV